MYYRDMETQAIYIVILATVNIPVYILLGKLMFGDWEGFWESIKFWLKPDILSLFHGEHWEDSIAEFKLGIFCALCFGIVFLEYLGIAKLLEIAKNANIF